MAKMLDALYEDSRSILSIKDGLQFECALCEKRDTRCMHDPRRWCRRVYKGGTLLEECEQAIRAAEQEAVVSCTNCGRAIDPVYLAHYPGAIVCARCQAAIVHKSRSTK